jgi:hypothetical protein
MKGLLNEIHSQIVIGKWQLILHFPLKDAKKTKVESLDDLSYIRRKSDHFHVIVLQSCENLWRRMNNYPSANR